MDRDGQAIIAYLGEDRQVYFHNPGKPLCKFRARIMHLGTRKVIYITEIPETYDGQGIKAPPGYEIDGI